jgi:hypothetical protein
LVHHKQDKQTKDFERLHAFNLESSATRAKVALCTLMAGRAQPAYELPRARSMQEKRVFEGLKVLVTKSPAGKMAEKDVSTLVRIGGGEVRSSCALHQWDYPLLRVAGGIERDVRLRDGVRQSPEMQAHNYGPDFFATHGGTFGYLRSHRTFPSCA